MGIKGRLRRLEQVTKPEREAEELAQMFMNSLARIKAQVDGKPPPPPHPRSHDARYRGTLFEGEQTIVGGGPVMDLSE